MSNFISDEDMAKLEAAHSGGAPAFISDEDMARHEANNTTLAKTADIGESIPVLGPLVRKAGNAVASGIDAAVHGDKEKSYLERAKEAYDKFEGDDQAADAQFAADHPVLDAARTAAGAAVLPLPGAGAEGLAGSALRVLGTTAIAGADKAVRGGSLSDVAQAEGLAGGVTAGLEAIPYIGRSLAPGAQKLAESPVGQYLAQKFGQAASSAKENLPNIGEKLGTVAGGAAGWKLGSFGGHMGGALGAAGGAQVGSSIGKKVGEAGVSVLERLQNAPETLGKYAPLLMSAEARGPTALAAAHYVMSQNDPAYQKLFQGDEAK